MQLGDRNDIFEALEAGSQRKRSKRRTYPTLFVPCVLDPEWHAHCQHGRENLVCSVSWSILYNKYVAVRKKM